jgi:hypothetical protein
MDIRTEVVMTLEVQCAPGIDVGKTLEGDLTIIPIVGGTFEGPGIRGTVCHGGADWFTRLGERHYRVSAKYWLMTDDGCCIGVENGGVVAGLDHGTAVLRTTPRFLVDMDGKYAALGAGTLAGELWPGREPGWVRIVIHRLS